jgi:hypothetical protein
MPSAQTAAKSPISLRMVFMFNLPEGSAVAVSFPPVHGRADNFKTAGGLIIDRRGL